MPSDISVENFEQEFKSFMEEWEEWGERFTEHDNSDSITSAYNLFIKVWNIWFDGLSQTELFSSSKDLQPTFERLSPIFEAFQTKWNEKYSEDPVFKSMSEKHTTLYNKMRQVMDNIDATLKKK